MERGGLGARLLVQRQGEPSSCRRLGWRRDRCTDARARSMARGVWPGEAVQSGGDQPAVGRRKTSKLVDEDLIDAHCGGFLSNICLACMPVWEEAKIVNMISVCLDTTLTTTKCNRYSFRVHDYAPAQAVAI